MEALSKRNKVGIQNLDRPQEPLVLHDKPKAKSKTSKMGSVPVKI